MQIDRVSYARNKNLSHAERESIEVSSLVAPEDDPQETLLFLRNWVNEKLQIKEEVAKLDSRKSQLQRENYDLERSVKRARDKWQKVKEFLEKVGIENFDDIPF